MLVVMLGKLTDLALQIANRIEGAAAERLVTDKREPTLDLIEPRAVGANESAAGAENPWRRCTQA
jgi:hypothetical protein